MKDKELIEKLAEYAHGAWGGWMKYLFWKSVKLPSGDIQIPAEYAKNLQRLMDTDYKDLSLLEKESDKEEAMTIISIFEETKKEENNDRVH